MSVRSRHQQRYCDGLSRRAMLQIGSLTCGGLAADALAWPALAGAGTSDTRGSVHKSVIMVYLSGGLAHQDSFDLKPQAPAEVRGEFSPIATNLPGLEVCELLPRLATLADKYTVIRSLVGQRDEHSSFQNVTGYTQSVAQREGWPSFGSVVAHRLGATDRVTPPFVDLFPTMQHRPYNSPSAGMLGRAFQGVKADGEDLASMKLRFVEAQRFAGRRQLLDRFDQFRRALDSPDLDGMDANYRRAFDMLTSTRVADALDLEQEDPRIRERYGESSPKHQGDGAPLFNDHLLMARRLVEAGVRAVTVAYGFWDTHGNNFGHLRNNLPVFDRGIAALIDDLYERGLDRDVTLVVWGEFGRTPRINENAGRDHWPRVNGALVASGGLRMGQVIGATDKDAGSAAQRPLHYQQLLATVYRALGIHQHQIMYDRSGRPVPLLPHHIDPIAELL